MKHTSIKTARSWQAATVRKFRNQRYTLNQSPGGSGKSLTQCMLGALDIEDTGNKQLILVPQNHIHHGFYNAGRISFRLAGNGRVRRWEVRNNFCTDKNTSKLARLRDFLLSDADQLRHHGRLAAIATHKAMTAVWQQLSPTECSRAIQRLSVRIDEAHHVRGVFSGLDSDTSEAEVDGNRLGEFVQYALDSDQPDSQVHLTTATFFRGDRRAILGDSVRDKFVTFQLPWEEYYKGLNLKSCEYDFLTFVDDPLDQVAKSIRREPHRRHLIILPAMNHGFRNEDTLESLMQRLRKMFPWEQLLDLVTPDTQAENKVLLLKQPARFHVIVACRLFDEGTDWPICDRMHNTDACEKSMTLAVQRFFRPFRYHPQKKSVHIYSYIPTFEDALEDDDKRQLFTDRFNAIMACVVTNGELIPVRVEKQLDDDSGQQESQRVPIQELYGHEKYLKVVESLTSEYERLADKSDPANADKIVEMVLNKFGVPEGVTRKDLKSAVRSLLIRIVNPEARRLGATGFGDVGFDAAAIARLGFDKVWKKTKHRSVLCHGTENISTETVRQLFELINRPLTRDEIADGIRRYFARTSKRPTFQSGWIDELETTSSSVEKQLRRHHDSTLAQEVDRVLGHETDGLLERTREVIQLYADKGIRLGNKYGSIPELGISSFALNARLQTHCGTTFAAEVERMLGPLAASLELKEVRQVIASYRKRGMKLHRKYGYIPELKMSSYNLSDRLLRSHGITLSALANEV